MNVILFSFGFKHALPEAETIFDVRFLPNPYYVPELSSGTGLEQDVSSYVLNSASARDFLNNLKSFLLGYIKGHAATERTDFRIGIGCTGGRHRSVAVVEIIKTILEHDGIETRTFHRDIDKD